MGVKFSNNGHSTLAASITSSDTSITVASGHGARFPSLGAGDYFYATLIDASNNLEIVKCTARSSDVLTVVRGQESTTARAYAIADRIELRVTAQGITDATDVDNILPDQSSANGYFLTSDGTNSSWAAGYSLPSQTGNSGKFLTTDGTNESWANLDGSPILQRVYYNFSDASTNGSSGGWNDAHHPIGDGTLNITPTATGNIIQIQFNFFIGHVDTWQSSTQKVVVSTDGGSSYSNSQTLGNDAGYGGVMNYLSGNSRVGDTHSGILWHVAANTNNHKFKWQYYGASGGAGFYVNYAESNNAGGTAYSYVILTEYDTSSSAITNGGGL